MVKEVPDETLNEKFSKNLGFECKVIKWKNNKPRSAIMETARNFRYSKSNGRRGLGVVDRRADEEEFAC